MNEGLAHKHRTPRQIAALFVETGGSYYGDLFGPLLGVDPWDVSRDARKYAGPHPVVAHPPCERWGDMWMGSPLVIAKTGHRKKLGDDGGCFAAALAAVRKWGGVLEHPEGSKAWKHFGIIAPPRGGGWIKADSYGGFSCRVEQIAYGHVVRKPTWLYSVGCDLPELKWGVDPSNLPSMVQPSKARLEAGRRASVNAHGIPDQLRISTPEPFRDILISMARSVEMADA